MSDKMQEIKAVRDFDMVMAQSGSFSAGMFTLDQVRWLIAEVERLTKRCEHVRRFLPALVEFVSVEYWDVLPEQRQAVDNARKWLKGKS